MKYDRKQIAFELQATAQGDAYYGNALYVARDLPETTLNDKQCLTRWMYGTQTSEDRFRLQDIVINVMREDEKEEAITTYYQDRNNSGQSPLEARP